MVGQTDYVAKALLINPENHVLILTRSETDPDRPGGFDLPGGGVDDDELLHLAAAREIDEECGLTVDPNDLEMVYSDTRMKREWNLLRFLFLTRKFSGEVVLSHEHSAFRWIPIHEAARMIDHPVWSIAISYLIENEVIAEPSNK